MKPGSARALLATLTDADADAAWPPSDAESASCCPCCAPDDPSAPTAGVADVWVGCDSCDGWFHAACVRVPEAQARGSSECPATSRDRPPRSTTGLTGRGALLAYRLTRCVRDWSLALPTRAR